MHPTFTSGEATQGWGLCFLLLFSISLLSTTIMNGVTWQHINHHTATRDANQIKYLPLPFLLLWELHVPQLQTLVLSACPAWFHHHYIVNNLITATTTVIELDPIHSRRLNSHQHLKFFDMNWTLFRLSSFSTSQPHQPEHPPEHPLSLHSNHGGRPKPLQKSIAANT